MENSNKLAKQERNLPTLVELYADKDLAIKESELQVLINQPPSPAWVKKHPIAKKEVINEEGKKIQVPLEYISIERLQWLMKRIFGGYQREILETKIIANSVQVTVRIHYRNIVTGQMEFQDGVGAVPIQIDSKKGNGAIDFANMRSNSIQLAAPAAATYAEKDAIGCLGKLFGSDINRQDETVFISNRESFDKLELDKKRRELSDLIDQCQDTELTDKIIDEVTTEEEKGSETIEKYESWISQFK